MTRDQLKTKLQSICQEDTTILDVFFYKTKNKQMIVVPYRVDYKSIDPSLYISTGEYVEEIIMKFYDKKRLGAVLLDTTNDQQSSSTVEEI